jgi:hypothetical protein
MNDEMAVLNKGWHSMLTKYVACFPIMMDHCSHAGDGG